MKAINRASSVSPTAASRNSSGACDPPWAAVTPSVKREEPDREKACVKLGTPAATNPRANATRLNPSHDVWYVNRAKGAYIERIRSLVTYDSLPRASALKIAPTP